MIGRAKFFCFAHGFVFLGVSSDTSAPEGQLSGFPEALTDILAAHVMSFLVVW